MQGPVGMFLGVIRLMARFQYHMLDAGRLHRDVKELNELDVFESVNIVPMVPAMASQGSNAGAAEAESDKSQAITDLEYQLTEKPKFGSFTCQGGATVVRFVRQCCVIAGTSSGIILLRFRVCHWKFRAYHVREQDKK